MLLCTGAPAPPRRWRARRAGLLAAAFGALALAWPWLVPEPFQRAQALAQALLARSSQPAFAEVRSEVIGPEGDRALIVTGQIVNAAARAADLAPLEILVRNGDEQVLVAWTSAPPQRRLQPGEAARFEARLPRLPAGARDVRVHFTKARGTAFAALTDAR